MTTPLVRRVSEEAERGLRYGILAVLLVGVRRRNVGAVVNATGALLASFIPPLVAHRYDVPLRPWQRLYGVSAMLTHAYGMLGPYDDVWWWDHVTHTHSASILAGIVYARARNRGRDPAPRVIAAVTVVGVGWEAAEYVIHALASRLGFEPILIPYGPGDTAMDLVFDLVGALLVLLVGERLLRNLIHADD